MQCRLIRNAPNVKLYGVTGFAGVHLSSTASLQPGCFVCGSEGGEGGEKRTRWLGKSEA